MQKITFKRSGQFQNNLFIIPIKEEDEYKSDIGLFRASTFEDKNVSFQNKLNETFPSVDPFPEKVVQIIKSNLHSNNKRLFLAAEVGDYEALDTILSKGHVCINVKRIDGTTPLHWACANGHFECVESLISCDEIRFDIKDIHGYTALHWAAINGHDQCVSSFLGLDGSEVFQGRFRINAKDYRGQTALHLAAKRGHYDVVDLLLNCKIIGINLRDMNGETALDLAIKHEHYNIIELIQNSRENK